jgi:twitching motility protein PilT
MSTLHTLDATETINRIISAFPPYQQKQVRLQLGSVLKAVISQRLVPRADGKGRVPAIEVLLATARVRELIEDKDRTKEIPDAIAQGHVSYGMQTFDQSLMGLLKAHLITYEEALRQATNPDDFALRVSGVSGTSDSRWDSFEKAPEAGAPPTAGPAGARPQAAPAPRPIPSGPPGPAQQLGRLAPSKTAAPRPAAPGRPADQAGGDDDFQIERF